MPDTAMIFAAGRGTRMGELTKDLPKPLINVAGKPLIDHALALINNSSVQDCVVNVHYLADQIVDHLDGSDAVISRETTLLETGGGLKQALTLLNSVEIVTLNSDAVWAGSNPIHMLLNAWDPGKMDALLMLVPPENAIGHKGKGDFILSEDGSLQRGPGMIYPGCQIIKTDCVKTVEEDVFSLNVVWDRLLAEKRIHGVEYDGEWCDVGHPRGIVLAEEMLERSRV
ncbi:nucleotidyltransferase family protein [Aliiroseovarius sp. 2305UL8-7]|uniref:nucleotidyltransferase family protein n=1 Tax=Aliiroseovarius conchicola TaxID=3121637 RepID=UPI003527F27B